MKVSLVTVCYNSAAIIAAALESARAQTWKDIELVIVDGGSTDDTVSIARNYLASHDQLVSERDDGIYNAMNKAVRMATGDLVYFLNSDDRLFDADVVADVVRRAQKTTAELVYGDVLCVGVNAGEYRKTHARIGRLNLPYERICHQAVFAARSLFDRYGAFDERYRICADHDWLVRVFSAGIGTAHLDRVICRFSVDGTHSKHSDVDRREVADIIRRHRPGPANDALAFGYRCLRWGYRRVSGHRIDR